MKLSIKIIIPVLLVPLALTAQAPQPPIDRSKMYELGNKRLRGELLTPEEEKYLKDFMTSLPNRPSRTPGSIRRTNPSA